MPPSDPYNPPTPAQKAQQHNQEVFRQQEQQRELQAERDKANQATVQQRQQAPGAIKTGSPQETEVRQEAMKEEQQALVQQNVRQISGTSDQFAAQREEALKSGSFNYGNVSYASKGTPASFVDKQGNIVSRPQGGITGRGSASESRGTIPVSKEETRTISTKTGGERSVTGEAALFERLTNNINSSEKKPEQKQNVTSNKPNQSKPKEPDLRERLASFQGEASRIIQTKESTNPNQPEAVPFIALNPFTGINVKKSTNEATKTRGRGASKTGQAVTIETIYSKGTEEVPATSIVDVLQFAPIGGLGVGAARSAARSSGSLTGKIITSTGEVIVPKGVKPPEEKTIFDTVKEAFTSKPKESEKPLERSMQRVSLGRGIGQELKTGEKGGTSLSGNKPSGKPPGETPKPTTKTTTSKSGQSLEQIVKEKETTKTEPTNYLGRGAKKVESLTGKTIRKTKPEPPETIFIPKPLGIKQKQGVEEIPIIPVLTGGKQITEPIPKQKEKEKIGITDLLTTQVTRGSPKTEQTSITDTIQVTKQSGKQETTPVSITDTISVFKEGGSNTPDITGGGLTGGLGSGIPGFLNQVSKSGEKRNYLGNVPVSDIVGVYKREEITYGRVSDKSVREKNTNLLGVFSTKKGKVRGI